MLARGILLSLLVVSGCGSSRPVSLDGATDGLVCTPGVWGEKRVDCNGTCVDTEFDPKNCGACGVVCPTPAGFCARGKCLDCLCQLTHHCCSGSCVDTHSDNDNCGACGNKCDTSAGFTCTGELAGKCTCVGDNMTDCGGVCVDTNTDPKNCGSCGTQCATYEICVGSCVYDDCAPPLMCCGGTVTDPKSDNNNCGSCGNVCDTANGFTCQNGSCSCIAAMTDCNGTCVNLQMDPSNCGACGTVCTGGVDCVGGTCCPHNAPNLCFGVCVDLQTDSNNCGACGCKCSNAICTSGQCALLCGTGLTGCGHYTDPACPKPIPTVCVSPQTDNNNCGACGNVCTGGQTCVNGQCT